MPDSVLVVATGLGLMAWVMTWAEVLERRREVMKELEDEEEVVVEAEPTGRKFERRFREEGSEWEPFEEVLALRVLACSFCDVPKAIADMENGQVFRTPFAEYRLAMEPGEGRKKEKVN